MAIEKQVNVVISAVDQYSKQILNFAGGFGTIASAAAVAEAAILGLSVAAAGLAVKIGSDLLKSSQDFHDGAIDVGAVAQSMGTDLNTINEILDDLTLRFPLTGKEAANAMELIAQMGYGSEDALKAASEAAVNMSMATGADMQTSVQVLTATMNSFNMGVEEAERLMNLFSAAQFTSALSAADMAESIKYAGSMSDLTGQSVEGMTAALALLRNSGLEASQAGTTLRMALANLMKETDKGSAALAKYGLTYNDVNPSVKSFSEIIGAFKGQAVDAKDAVDIFGVRQLAFTKIVNGGQEAFDKYRNSITGTSAGIDAVQVKMQKWEVVTANLGGSMDLLKKTLAGDLLPAVVEFIGADENSGIRGVISQVQKLEEEGGLIGTTVVQAFKDLRTIASDVFKTSFGDAQGFYNWLAKIFDALGTNLEVLTIWGGEIAKVFFGATDETDELKTALGFVETALETLFGSIAAIHDAFALAWYAANVGIDWLQNKMAKMMASLEEINLAALKIGNALGMNLSAEIESTTQKIEAWKGVAEDAFDTEKPKLWMDTVVDAGVKARRSIDDFGKSADTTKEKIEESTEATKKQAENTEEVAKQMVRVKDATVETAKELNELTKHEMEMEKIQARILGDLQKKHLEINAKLELKKMDIELKKIEGQAKATQAAFDSLGQSVAAAADATASMFGDLAGFEGSIGQRWKLEDMVQEQMDIQNRLVDSQTELTEAQRKVLEEQAKMMKQRREQAAKDGGAVPIEVIVSGDTKPWLKGLMQELMEEVFVQAASEAFSCMCES